MHYVATLIEEAWEHRRRRIQSLAIAAAAAFLLASTILVSLPLGPGSVRVMSEVAVVTSFGVLSKSPYLGVSCPTANSIACDRVGLAVWLKHPATRVVATINGAPLALNRYGDAAVNLPVPRRQFTGFLRPAGIVSRLHIHPDAHQMWFGGANAPSAIVRLTIFTATGKILITHLRVGLATGWG